MLAAAGDLQAAAGRSRNSGNQRQRIRHGGGTGWQRLGFLPANGVRGGSAFLHGRGFAGHLHALPPGQDGSHGQFHGSAGLGKIQIAFYQRLESFLGRGDLVAPRRQSFEIDMAGLVGVGRGGGIFTALELDARAGHGAVGLIDDRHGDGYVGRGANARQPQRHKNPRHPDPSHVFDTLDNPAGSTQTSIGRFPPRAGCAGAV